MLGYNLLVLSTFLFSSIAQSKKLSKWIVFIFSGCCFFVLWLTAGFRDQVGTDFISYRVYFDQIKLLSYENRGIEAGYYFLNKLVYFFNTNNESIFLTTSFIILILIFMTINRYSNHIGVSVYLFITLYFYFSSFNIVRQYIAVAIVFYALTYIVSNESKKYVACILIAMSFHVTAIVALLVYPFMKKNHSALLYLAISMITFCSIPFLPHIMGRISDVLDKYHTLQYGASPVGMIISGTLFLFALFHKQKLIKQNPLNIIYMNAMFLAFIFHTLGSQQVVLARFATYFYIFAILLIPNCLSILNKYIRISVYIVLFSLLLVYFNIQLTRGVAGVFPYQSIFSN